MSKKFNVVLVIPFYNEEKFIKATLHCLMKQKVSAEISWHALFVNNRSSDNTKKIVDDFCSSNRISYSLINEPRKGTVYSRKTGLVNASGLSSDIIISIDADTTFPNNFIQATYEDLVHTGGDVLVGKKRNTPEVELWKRLVSKNIFNYKRKLWNLEYLVFGPYFFGAFFAIKTQFFNRIPLFNPEKHEKFLGEDILLSRRCYYIGGKFIRSSSVVTPDERRTLVTKESGLGSFVGNKTHTHSKRHSVDELNFKSLSPKREAKIKQKLINFEAKRLIWMICDAYLFWLKTNKQYNNANKAVKKGMNFIGLTFVDLPNDIKKLTQNKMSLLIEDRYFNQVASRIETYLNG